jgi:hypothetical protein
MICLAACFTSTGELHERVYAPHTVMCPLANVPVVSPDELLLRLASGRDGGRPDSRAEPAS